MKKAHKIRIYPKKSQETILQKTFGSARFYWNFLLHQQMENYKHKNDENYQRDKRTYADLKKLEEYVWLKEVEAQALSQVTMDFKKALKNKFQHNFGFPKFKSKKYSKKSYRTAMGIKISERYFYVSKVGWVKMAECLRFNGKVMNVTISQTPSGKYFATFIVDTENKPVAVNTNQTIGLDLGLNHFCVTSAGEKIENPKIYRSFEKRLVIEQRKLSKRQERAKKEKRKLEDSKNYQKQKIRVARLHEKIANIRNNFLHQLSSRLIYENQVICIEDLDVKNMLSNRQLAKSITDVSWSEFVRQLQYKSEWRNRQLIKIDRYYPSSQVCSCCGYNSGKKPLNVREWICENCNVIHDRDVNASINIRTAGLAGIA